MTTTPKVWRATQQANFTDAGIQIDPAIADIGSGRYVAVWTEGVDGPIGTSPGMDLVGQIFDTRGNRIGGEFQVNRAFFMDDEVNASLDTRPGGGFVMAYVDVDAAGASICAQTYDVNGALVVGTPTTIQADTSTDFLSVPTVAVRADGSYLVAYNRNVAADGTTDVVGRVVSAAGAVGGEFSIYKSNDAAYLTDVDVLTNGNFVIGIQDADDPAQSDFDPLFQIFTAAGAFVAGNPIDTGPNGQGAARVAALTGGGFVAVWMELNIDGDAEGVRARIYNNAGTALTAPFTVNTTTAGSQREPDVTALNDGGFVVVWNDFGLHLGRGQRFDAAGHGVGVEFTASEMGVGAAPVLATLNDGRFIVGFDQFPVAGDADVWATILDPRTSPTVNFPSPFCDFDDDGKSGVLWRHDSGQVYFWEMNGLALKAEGGVAHAPVPNDWHIQGIGDFDGDGKSDLLWRHDSGQVYIWEMNGLGVKAEGGVVHAAVPNDWHILGLGDFDGDGKSDILWRHDSGQVYIWEMNGLQVKAEGTVMHAPVGNDWHVEDIGDYNNDGKSGDILWRHDSGQVYTWEMNGLGITAEGGVSHAPVPSDWHIFSQHNFV
jgi:hypothetical protein